MIEPQMSVVVPVYSVEKEYFEECILSLKQQTLEAIEIIIVADGVKKEILDLCKSFEGQDERIRVVEQENQGVAVARNNGILNAKAPYITFVDADDWVEPEFCAFFYDNFKNNPDVQIISSAAYINKNDEEIENPFWNGEKKYFTGKEKEEMEFYREENQFLQDYFNKQENDLSDGEVFIVTDKYENDDEYHRYKVAQYKNNLECKCIAFEKEFLQNVKLGDVVKKIDGKYIYDEKATQYINDSINEIKQNIIRKRDF